jgi:hypothetical protein
MSDRRREEKKAGRSRQEAGRADRRRQGVIELLRNLGLSSPRPELIEALMARRYPEPDVVLADGLAEDEAARKARLDVLEAFNAATVMLQPHDVTVTLPVFFADHRNIDDACQAELEVGGNAGPAWTEFAKSVVPYRGANTKRAAESMCRVVDVALLPHCDFSKAIYFWDYAVARHNGRPRFTVVVRRHQAQAVTFVRDGISRPAWRCGLPMSGSIKWAQWGRNIPGFGRDAEMVDVYIQSHALQRLHERLCFEPVGLTDWAWQSLNEPVLHPQDGGWLVEFRLFQKLRLGYFRAEFIDGRILITTFLFLTNEGTPEGRRLREKTRFTTDQIAWLKIDQLSYFLLSDVQDDLRLRALFDECGCGHLFDMMKPEARVSTMRAAAETRRHLKMPPLSLDTFQTRS